MKVKDLVFTCQEFQLVNIWYNEDEDPISYDPTEARQVLSATSANEMTKYFEETVQAWYMTNDILTIYI